MLDLGQILKEKREELSLSISEVQEKLGITSQHILSMEDGKFNELPQVFGFSYVQSYVKLLKLNNEETKKLLDDLAKTLKSKQIATIKESSNKLKTNATTLKKYSSGTNSRNKRIFGYTVLSIVIIGFSIGIYLSFFSIDPQNNVIDSNSLKNDTATIGEKGGLLDYFEGGQSDSLILEAFAIDTCWIKLNTDGKKDEEVLMLSNMKKRWSANEYFIITQGNIGAVQFSRNGKLLEPFGTKGTVVKNIKVTRDKVTL